MISEREIINYFNKIDEEKKERKTYVINTKKGIFGVSNLNIINKFFNKINLSKEDVFLDIGSGDGRVCILASLKCKSTGIEFDKNLVNESNKHNQLLNTKAVFLQEDYENFNFNKINIIFSFADQFFTNKFIEKLKKEFKGTLYIYQGIFTPENIKKGPTIWIEQTPIISFEFK